MAQNSSYDSGVDWMSWVRQAANIGNGILQGNGVGTPATSANPAPTNNTNTPAAGNKLTGVSSAVSGAVASIPGGWITVAAVGVVVLVLLLRRKG